jgi:phospholipid-translocating ATPase
VRFYDPLLEEILDDPENKHHEILKRSLIFLACCHTIIIDEKKGVYNAASPDELALVNAAKQFGYIFEDRDGDDNMVIFDKRNNKKLKY